MIYTYETSTSGVSSNIIANKQATTFQMFSPQNNQQILPNSTFQIITTSAVSGTIQATLDGVNFTDIITFSATTQDSQIVIYDGLMTDFRVNVSSISGKLKVVVVL